MTRIDKIKDIINHFTKNNRITTLDKKAKQKITSKTCTWELGTNFFQSWKKLVLNANNAINNQNNKPTFFTIFKINNIDTEFKDRYSIFIGDAKNITPCTCKSKTIATSTLRQYLQIGNSLGLIDTKNTKSLNQKKIKVNINPKFWQINPIKINEQLTNLCLITLIHSYDSRIHYQRNLGLSIFLSLIDAFDDSIFEQLNLGYVLEPRTSRNKNLTNGVIDLNTENGREYIKHLRGVNSHIFKEGKQTYIELCDELLKRYKFDSLVDGLYKFVNGDDTAFNDVLDDILLSAVNKDDSKKTILWNKWLKILNNTRLKLRDNIINVRVKTFDDIVYSDLENSLNNNIHVQSQEACHIYDFYKLKTDLLNYIIDTPYDEISEIKLQEIVNHADDANNGIFLNKICHSIFDKNYVWFDEEGKLVYLEECIDKVKEAFGDNLENIHIKSSTLSNAMKEYIICRNSSK